MPAPDDVVVHIGPEDAGQTLAAVLKDQQPEASWGTVRKQIRGRQVLVNGNLCLDDARRLTAGEVVKLLAQPTAPPPTAQDVRIRHHDAALVVVDKPSGMTSVRHSEELNWSPRRKQFQPTLDELLPGILAKLGVKKTRRGGPPVVRAVHRLDRETSGLIAFARSVAAERHLQGQFRDHSADRRYLALVPGSVEAVTIESWLVRDRGDGRRGSDPARKAGQRAVTHIDPIERLGDYTLVQCRLETGRTHQIRIHLAELGHPVCGEKVYRRPTPHGPEIPDLSGAPRLALHATELALVHPETNQPASFSSPWPADLQALVERLRGGAGRRR